MLKPTPSVLVLVCFCFSCCYAAEWLPGVNKEVTGIQLYEACKTFERYTDYLSSGQDGDADRFPVPQRDVALWLMGYERGLFEANYHYPNFAWPAQTSLPQRVKIIIKYADDHPRDLSLNGFFLYLVAMKDAFGTLLKPKF